MEDYIRGCTRSSTSFGSSLLSVASAPFELPSEAKRPFSVLETVESNTGTGRKSLVQHLVEQNRLQDPATSSPLIIIVENVKTLLDEHKHMRDLLHQHWGIQRLQIAPGPGAFTQKIHDSETDVVSFALDFPKKSPVITNVPVNVPDLERDDLPTCNFSDATACIKFVRISAYLIACRGSQPSNKLVLVESMNPSGLSGMLSRHLSEEPYRLYRLKDLRWIFCDMCIIFRSANVLKCVSKELSATSGDGFDDVNIERVKDLHRNKIGVIIEVLETIHVCHAVCTDLRSLLATRFVTAGEDAEELFQRMTQLEAQFRYEKHRLGVFQQQFQNHIDLSCNIITIQQGDAVNRLNALAFMFLPVTVVAGVFGMTEFHGNPVYFPVAAVVVLLILCVLAVSARPRYRPSRRRLSSACMALLRKTKNRAALVFHTRNRSPPELPISNQQTAALPRTPTDNMEPYAPPSVPYYHNGNQHTMAHPVPVPHYQDRNQQLVALSPTDAMEHYARPSIPFYHYANQQTMAYPTNTIVP